MGFVNKVLLEITKDGQVEIITKWRQWTNMTASELKAWNESPISRLASIKPGAVISRNLELLETPVSNWTVKHFTNAKRTINFNNRMSGGDNGKEVRKGIPFSKRDISLLNWAYRPSSVSLEKFKYWTSKEGIEKAKDVLR
jgi:hypothetical protein